MSAPPIAAIGARFAVAVILAVFAAATATATAVQDGRPLIEASLARYSPPAYVYQEQTMVLSDLAGNRTVRTVRYYARNRDGWRQRLLVIQTPAELRGRSVFIARNANGGRRGPMPSSLLFGSEVSVADFEGEQPGDFRYTVEDSQDLDRVAHHVVLATPRDAGVTLATGYGERRLFLRKDNLFVARIDYLDSRGNVARRRTFRDPQTDETGAWRAAMTLTEDLREARRTLLKVDRRVHSADYVPDAVFAGLP